MNILSLGPFFLELTSSSMGPCVIWEERQYVALFNDFSCVSQQLSSLNINNKTSSQLYKRKLKLILMESLAKLEVYVKEGRVLDPDEQPVPDAISVGLAELAHGSSLAKYNAQFEHLRERRRVLPISDLLHRPSTTTKSNSKKSSLTWYTHFNHRLSKITFCIPTSRRFFLNYKNS
jgi:hypothetical protein